MNKELAARLLEGKGRAHLSEEAKTSKTSLLEDDRFKSMFTDKVCSFCLFVC